MNKKNYYLFAFLLILSLSNCTSQEIDTLEFQKGYPLRSSSALEQLETFPSPRYKPGNDLIRLFNWMNPNYMGGGGQPNISKKEAIEIAFKIQEELILHWNYFIFIPNSTYAFNPKSFTDSNSPLGSYVTLANKYPEIPLGTTIFWMQLQPLKLGSQKKAPNILLADHPDRYYIKDNSGNVIKRKLNFAAPDSLFIEDGQNQKKCLQSLISHLTRPINLINENGEEPPGVMNENLISGDADMIAEKEKLKIEDWHTYISYKKNHFRNLYSSQFMSLPELKNTWFTVYCVEGGPIDRFDWNSTKRSCSQIKGNYYSTPDFYPRHADNWKIWKGPWHGWKWINDGRKVEIKNGDRFFSPFIAAGWANDPKQDMRPGQWLGLLKCLSVVGAEFYYVAYFNLKAPFSLPENYVWQAAIPAYSQAITSHYEELFKNGNVLKDSKGNPIVTYPVDEKDVIVTVRKHDKNQQYIIATTVQPSSNTERTPLKKNIEINIDGDKIKIETRRQGSVYFLDKSVTPFVFYQLDKWHQYEHPSHWRKELIYEAEVFDSTMATISIKTNYNTGAGITDLTAAQSFIHLKQKQWAGYFINSRDLESFPDKINVWIFAKSNSDSSILLEINGTDRKFKGQKKGEWEWVVTEIPKEVFLKNKNSFLKIISLSDDVEVDKIIITETNKLPDLSNY